MYELYPEYSTVHDNYFFAQDERSPTKPPKLTPEEVDEARKDWLDGLRRIDQERREKLNERLNELMFSSHQSCDNHEEYACEAEDHSDSEEVDDEVGEDEGVVDDVQEE